RFRRRERAAGQMRGGASEFVHRDVLLVDPAKDLGLRDVGGGVEIDKVAGRAVGLVAGKAAVTVGPVGPMLDIREVQVRDRLAVVALHAANGLSIALAE